MHAQIERRIACWSSAGVAVVAATGLWITHDWWRPKLQKIVGDQAAPAFDNGVHDHERSHDHEGSHDREGHDEANSLELSPQARGSMGLQVGALRRRDLDRTISLPAVVVPQPGRTITRIAAPVTGVVTAVYAVPGEAVRSGEPLIRLRLTHEDLVRAQSDILRTLGQLDVEQREIARLEKITSAAVAGKVLLERQYQRDKLRATLNAQREALLLHGLSPEQVSGIVDERKLIREVVITAPLIHDDASLHDPAESPTGGPVVENASRATDHRQRVQDFVVQELAADKGEAVQAGDPLCVLADYSELFIEGQAFEQDADTLVQSANERRRVTAIPESGATETTTVEGLEIVYISNEVQRRSRALHFYVALTNEKVREVSRGGDRRFVTWRFKPGQRMQVQVPVERWEDVFVLPVEAIAEEGPESFVFVENGDHFDRRPVQIRYRGRRFAVIADDGSLFAGERIALSGAHQLQMALKQKAGGGADPHTGHNH